MKRQTAAPQLILLAAGLSSVSPLLLADGRSRSNSDCVAPAEEESVEVPAGARLYSTPGHEGIVLSITDVPLSLPVRSHCGKWLEFRLEGLKVFFLPGDTYVRPVDAGKPRVVGITATSREDRIQDALQALRMKGRRTRIGPWTAFTDCSVSDVAVLSKVAAALADDLEARYGLRISRETGDEAVVVFTRLDDYWAFLLSGGYALPDGRVNARARSHTESGLAAVSIADGLKLGRIYMVHELVHLLLQRAFRFPIPGWLSEGMAEDLAWCRVGPSGHLKLGSVEGSFRMRGGTRLRLDSKGPAAGLADYIEEVRRASPLKSGDGPRSLTDLFSEQAMGPVHAAFDVGGERRELAAAALAVRFFIDGCEGLTRATERGVSMKFRAYLQTSSHGTALDTSTLLNVLAVDRSLLDAQFENWINAGLPPCDDP